jgi:hypothetical protein
MSTPKMKKRGTNPFSITGFNNTVGNNGGSLLGDMKQGVANSIKKANIRVPIPNKILSCDKSESKEF